MGRRAMDAAGVRHSTELYEGAHHGYTMSDMGAYHEAAAERHFNALFALLQRASRAESIAGVTRVTIPA
jgi:carboxymethylenebutenolidase